MRIIWQKRNGIETDISEVVSSVTWGGTITQVARTADVSIINAPFDQNISRLNLNIATGDIIKLCEDTQIIFTGEVQTKEKLSEIGVIVYSCLDYLNHLLKSTGVYNFTNLMPEQIVKAVCSDFKIGIENIASTNIVLAKIIADNISIYDIIMTSYTKASKQNNKKYMVLMRNDKLSVVEMGKVIRGFVLSEENNITKTTYQESIDNMVNIVKIYDSSNKQIGEVRKEEQIKKYGIFQRIYKTEKGVNETVAASNMFVDVKKKVSVEGINGCIECMAGRGVQVYDTATALNGLFWIDSDTHTWENGIHTMNLELNYECIMDIKEESGE